MARPDCIELGEKRDLTRIPILYEDRSVLAVDKPAGWMLVPFTWQRTQRNLQAAISSSIAAGDFWARSRNLKFLRNIHRLDADTTGILLFAKSHGAVETYGELFESRRMQKTYLAVVHGTPRQSEWTCTAPLGPDPLQQGRIRVDMKHGKESETSFKVLASSGKYSLVEAQPHTGRTHQIRVHLFDAGHAVAGDDLYGPDSKIPMKVALRYAKPYPMALRAVGLHYFDPFLRKPVRIRADDTAFRAAFGFPKEAKAPAVSLPAPAAAVVKDARPGQPPAASGTPKT